MKYIRKIPREKEEATEKLIQDGWKILREPSSLIAVIAASMPISIILMSVTFAYFGFIFPDKINALNADGISIEFYIKNIYLPGPPA